MKIVQWFECRLKTSCIWVEKSRNAPTTFNQIEQGWPTCLQLGSTSKFLDNSQSTGR